MTVHKPLVLMDGVRRCLPDGDSIGGLDIEAVDFAGHHGARHAWDFANNGWRKNFAGLQTLSGDLGWSFARAREAYTPEFAAFGTDELRLVHGRGAWFEPTDQNLFPRYAPTAAQLFLNTNVSDTTEPVGAPIAGLNWLLLNNSAATASATMSVAGLAPVASYTAMCVVATPDDAPPLPSASPASGEMFFVVGGLGLTSPTLTVTRIGERLWLVTAQGTTGATASGSSGVWRYNTQSSARALKFSGFGLFTGLQGRRTAIVTAGATVTRPADVAASSNVAVDGAFAVAADVEFGSTYDAANAQYVLDLHDGSDSNRIRAYRDTSGNLIAQATVAGVEVLNQTLGAFPGPHRARLLISHDGNQWQANLNGSDLAPVVSAAPSGLLTLSPAQRRDGTLQPRAWLRSARVLPYAPDAGQRADLTGIEDIVDLDFVANRYRLYDIDQPADFLRVPAASFSRPSSRLAADAAGVLRYFPTDVPARTDAGLSVWASVVNKCTNYNAAPQALVSMGTLAAFNAAAVAGVTAGDGDANTLFGIVDDTAALAATAELAALLTDGRLTGRVLKIDNTSGAVSARFLIGGQTGNSNQHVVSAWRRGAGTGAVRLNTVPATMTTLPAAYERMVVVQTPTGSTNFLTVHVAAGSVGYFILNQLEEATFASPPIIVAGAAATRAVDIPTQQVALNGDFTLFLECEIGNHPCPPSGEALGYIHAAANANERLGLFRSASNSVLIQNVTGGVTTTTTFLGAGVPGIVRAAVTSLAGSSRASVNGAAVQAAAAARPIGMSRLSPGLLSGLIPFNGAVRRLRIINRALSDSELIAITGA